MSAEAVTVQVDAVAVRLREHHDFGFLRELGTVFCVFDQQDSGNLCFGVDAGSERLFVKYAGAATVGAYDRPEDAVRRLKQAMPVHEALHHPGLVELREHFPVGAGFAAVFRWFPGESLGIHPASSPSGKQRPVEEPFRRHRKLPLDRRLGSLDTIFAFHEHVAVSGYVAVDFYDGCILYDFSEHTTVVCDIDFYAELPYTNTMGRMWGSTRFMSPEEFELGATIDEVTNVFNMGATAFVLLGGGRDRSFELWEGGEGSYEVACRAVDPDRSQRHPSIAAFRRAWSEARG